VSLFVLALLALAAALPPSAAWLARLPDGEAKRKFILDCTGCHQFDEKIALVDGRARTEAEWAAAVTRMLGYAGARTAFPVIAADREAKSTAAWLARHLSKSPAEVVFPAAAKAEITEFMLPEPGDLPHDLAIERSGSVLVTGMFTHVLYRLDPALGRFSSIPIPVEKANPRAIEIDSLGRVWVVLGAPNKLAVMERDTAWRSFDVGMYPHSLAIGPAGRVWFNGHFTHSPELIGSVEGASGTVATHEVPAHPTLGKGPGGPIPYELRVGPDGRVWGSELAGNRIFALTPTSGRFEVFSLPTPHSGPRRFDVDSKGIVWIPAYGANLLVRFDPGSGAFSEIPLPVRDAVPYIVRVDRRSGALWIGTGAADALLRYDPATGRFETYPLPSKGALIRHLAIDARNGTVWAAYGASPGIPARIARVQRR
jgi:virginiamycin B lyase